MNDQEKDIDIITKFFDLDLTDEELVDFETRLSKDETFRQKFNAYDEARRIVNEASQTNEEKIRLQKWKKLLNTEENKQPSKKIPWKWMYSIAAGLLLIFSFWQLNTAFKKPNMEQLITDSWNKKIGLDFNTTRGSTTDSLKQQISLAYYSYQNKNYQKVLELLKDYSPSVSYYEDALLLKGLSNYKKGQVDFALQTLDSLANYPTGKKTNVAKWYQGLIHLEQGNIIAAKQFLMLPNNKFEEIKLKE